MRLHPARAAGLLRAPWTPAWAKDELWRRARAVPSLDLRFAENKSLVDSVSGQNLITFTRASTGTYVDSDGVIRSAATNLLLQSEDFSTSWTNTRSSEQVNVAVAPNGTITADKLIEDGTANNTHSIMSSFVSAPTGTYTASLYIKAAERAFAFLGITDLTTGGAERRINLSTGVVDSVNVENAGSWSSISSSVVDAGNGWWRLSVTATRGAGAAMAVQIYPGSSTGAKSYTGDGTSGIFIWGAQLEVGSTATPYIPTGATINSAPRFGHNPLTGECLGLLVEEQRQNLLLNSATLSTQTVTVTAVAHTLSFYGTGTVTLSGASTAGPLVGTAANSRVSLTFTPTAGSLTLTVSGSVTNANLEIGSFATSWIPTTGTAATRTADIASITGTNFSSWYRQDESCAYWQGSRRTTTGFPDRFRFSDGTNANRWFSYWDAANNSSSFEVSTGSINQVAVFGGGSSLNTTGKAAFGVVANNVAAVYDGAVVGIDTSVTVPSASQVTIGQGFTGTIQRLTYFPQRLPNSTLQSITQ